MANKVTATIKTYSIGITAYHTDTKTMDSTKLTVTHFNEKTALKSYRKVLENSTTRVLKVQLLKEEEHTYSMSAETFYSNAQDSESIKIGFINRAVKGFAVTVLCYDVDSFEEKLIETVLEDADLETARKVLEDSTTVVADIINAAKASGYKSMNPKKFIELGTIDDRAKAEE